VIDVNSQHVQRLTEGSASDVYPTWSADGTEIMFTSYGADGALIMLADMESSDLRPITTLELGDNFDPQWSPDETLILFESRYYDDRGTELALMDADGEGYLVLAENERSSFSADWSPNGSQIVFISDAEEDSEIYIINTDGTGNKRLTDNDYSELSPDWRPTLLD
jgi:TolB protein